MPGQARGVRVADRAAGRLEPRGAGPAAARRALRKPRAREADQILTAESGWSWGEIGYGPDKKAELRRAMDHYRAEMGLEPIDWSESTERSDAESSSFISFE